MVKYDDFLGTELDTTKWESTIEDSGTITVSGGFLHLSSGVKTDTQRLSVYSKKEDFPKGKYRARVVPKSGGGNSTGCQIFKGAKPLPDEIAVIQISGTTGDIIVNTRRGGVWDADSDIATGQTLGVAYELEIEVTETQVIFRAYDAGGVLVGSETRTTPDFGSPPSFGVFFRNGSMSATEGQDGDVDWIDVPEEAVPPAPEIAGIPITTLGIIGVVIVIVAIVVYFVTRRRP